MLTREAPRTRYRMQGEASQHITAPASVLWEMVADVTRMGEWSPETHSAEWLGGANGPALGARFRGHNRRSLLERWSTRPRVTACEPGREFAFTLGTRSHDFVVWRYRFEEIGDGTTKVTESVTVRGYALYGLLRPRRRERQLVEGMRITLRNLKRAAEAP
jgi:hypothetical protein